MSKKSKLITASLFSLLALGTLSALSTTFINHSVNREVASLKSAHDVIDANETILINNENKELLKDASGDRDYKLIEDVVIDSITITAGTYNLDLNGYVLSFTDYSGFYVEGNGTVVNINDSNPNAEHKYYVDPEYHHWVLDEQLGDHIVKGGLLYSDCHARVFFSSITEEEYDVVRSINIYGGTVCGAYADSAFNIRCFNDSSDLYLTVDGGAISGNARSLFYGGPAVILEGNATFTLKSGLISDNYCNPHSTNLDDINGGAIYSRYDASNIIIKNGLITRNTVGAPGSGSPYGGGAIFSDGTVTIDGGEISYNTVYGSERFGGGGGVSVRRGTVIMNGGLITHNKLISLGFLPSKGGGICGGNVQLHGGEISYNEVDGGEGGGVYGATNYEVNEGAELKIVNNKATLNYGGAYGSGDIKGKVIIADNECSESNANASQNLYFSNNPMNITGPLTGSNIYFDFGGTGEAFINYDLSGAETGFANEFLHYDGDDSKYVDFDENGNIVIKDVPGGGTTHTIATNFDSNEGNLLVSFDKAPLDQKIDVIVTSSGQHTLKSLLLYIDGVVEPLPITEDSFTMPDANVTLVATFNHGGLVHVDGKVPTCFEDGYKDYYYCPECNKCYEDSLTNIEIPDIEMWKITTGKIEKLKHILKHVEGKAPTVFDAGYRDYYQCEREECKHCYEDAEATIAIENIETWKTTKGAIAPTFGVAPFASLVAASGLILAAAIFLAVYPIRKYKLELAKANKSPTTFTDISYTKGYSPESPKLDKHTIRFKYRNTWMSYFIFTPKVDQVSESEIKARFNKLTKNGELKKYADNYYGAYLRKKLIILTIVALLALAAIGIAIYLYLLF